MPVLNAADKILVLVLLTAAGIRDAKKRTVDIRLVLLAGAAGIACRVFAADADVRDMLLGAGIGAALLLLSRLTDGAIGTGDGAVLAATGLILGFEENLELFFTGLVFCGIVGLFLLLILRFDRKKEIPFVPFLLIAYVEMLAVEALA